MMSTSQFLRPAACALLRQPARPAVYLCSFHASCARRLPPNDGGLNNILAGGEAPPVQVKTITPNGIQLIDGLVLPSACIFLDGKVFLWNVPEKTWDGWKPEHFEIFETVVPKPEILLLGTGDRVEKMPSALRQYLNKVGVQVDIMNTRNACSTYNLLAEEGRRVAAALLPITPRKWADAPAS
ncbi:NADH dehydrogenase 1 alpha subcomplex assembly factor 3 [Earliella scabrosa]|nr:NADH dehydrogenase 1 alpha subcomplex assembly factor 3 [Earliella scabrosa]